MPFRPVPLAAGVLLAAVPAPALAQSGGPPRGGRTGPPGPAAAPLTPSRPPPRGAGALPAAVPAPAPPQGGGAAAPEGGGGRAFEHPPPPPPAPAPPRLRATIFTVSPRA